MNITADTASLSYPDVYGNALKNRIFFTNEESSAEWFANRKQFARRSSEAAHFSAYFDTRSSDVGRGLTRFFVAQEIDASKASKFFRLSVYPDLPDWVEVELASLRRVGVVKGKWSKPKRIGFVRDFFD